MTADLQQLLAADLLREAADRLDDHAAPTAAPLAALLRLHADRAEGGAPLPPDGAHVLAVARAVLAEVTS